MTRQTMLWVPLALLTAAAWAEPVAFDREVQPILAERCLHCHGQDTQEAGLRLDKESPFFDRAESGRTPLYRGDPS